MNYIETVQYYPTPKPLAELMMKRFSKGEKFMRQFKSILEPSAGKGSLIKAFKDQNGRYCRTNFFACEISSELRQLLASDNIPVLSSDFLEADLSNHYFDGVMMNPPFRNGVEHLLKAWSWLAPGGRLICVLNASSVESPSLFGKDQLLAKVLADNESEVTYHENQFTNAENKTGVRVAVVMIDKPKAEENFEHIFEDLGQASDEMPDDEFEADEPGLIPFNQIRALVDAYRRTLAAHAALNKAYEGIQALCPVALPDGVNPTCPQYNEFALAVRKGCWHKVFAETKISNYMTGEMKKEFDKFVITQANLEFSEENVANLLCSLVSQIEMIRKKAVEQIFDKFTKYYDENRCHIEGWKTNKRWHANKKIILPFCGERDWSGGTVSLNYRGGHETVDDIEKALCLLTGTRLDEVSEKWQPEARCPRSSIYWVMRKVEAGKWYETEFFRAKLFKKGTLHLQFKTDELWRDFNVTACEGKNWVGG